MYITLRFDPEFQQRSTQRLPLAVALLIATIVHVLILIYVRIDLEISADRDTRSAIEITLRKEKPKTEPEAARLDEQIIEPPKPLISPDPTIVSAPVESRSSTTSDDQPQPVTDWQRLARQTARDVVSEKAEQERHRAEMWRRTHSVMFTPPRNDLKSEEPLLPGLVFDDRPFKGLGFKIGDNCYFGIPASVPENVDSDQSDLSTTGMRTTAVNLFHCKF